MGVEARCRPCHSAAHCRHMKRQPFLHNGCPCHGGHHCNPRRHFPHRPQLRHHHRCHPHCCCSLPSPLPLAIAVAVAVDHCRHHLCCVAVSHRRHCRPCRRPFRLRHRWPSQLPSPSAITVAIAIGHFQELLPWHSKNCIQTIKAKNAYLILFCLDSGQCTDQSRMTDQVSSGDGQHQCLEVVLHVVIYV
jgi:hypothetical protein